MATKTRTAGRKTDSLLEVLRVANRTTRYKPLETIFAQGDSCADVMYIRRGRVQLMATSRGGREVVVGRLSAGAFFGEGALAGQRRRRVTAEAMTGSTISVVTIAEMRRRLHANSAFSKWFRSHLLSRNNQIESDLVDQLFNRCEKRLARALLLLARFDEHAAPLHAVPAISKDRLAGMAGTTRSKVDVLMKKFRTLGFLEGHAERAGGLHVHCSMLGVVLQD